MPNAYGACSNATVPDDDLRSPFPVDLTVGTVVRAKLTVIFSDATVTPLDTVDKSIVEQVGLLFSWQVQPHISGAVELQAFITCPREDGGVIQRPCHSELPCTPWLTQTRARVIDSTECSSR